MIISSQARESGGTVVGNQMFQTGETSRNTGTGSQMQMQINHQETGISQKASQVKFIPLVSLLASKG